MIEPEMLCNCVNNSEQSRLDSYLLALTNAWSRGVLAGVPGPAVPGLFVEVPGLSFVTWTLPNPSYDV